MKGPQSRAREEEVKDGVLVGSSDRLRRLLSTVPGEFEGRVAALGREGCREVSHLQRLA